MITEITIKNFKSFECLTTNLAQITVLHGGNGTGKSNFLAVFELLRAIADKRLQKHVLIRGGAQAFLRNKNTSKTITIILTSKKAAYQLSLGEKNKTLLIEEEKICDDSSSAKWTVLTKREPESRHSHPFLRRVISYHFHDTTPTTGMRRSEIVHDNDYLRQDASNIAPILRKIRDTDKKLYHKILEVAKKVLPALEDFVLDPIQTGPALRVSLEWKQKDSPLRMGPHLLSDGAIRFICLATALTQPNPAQLMTIDEPELGLSETALAILIQLIEGASRKTQIIMATQSPRIVSQFHQKLLCCSPSAPCAS